MNPKTGIDFIEATKYQNMSGPSAQEQGLPQPPLELPVPQGTALIKLPELNAANIPSADLYGVILKRKSLRKYTKASLTLDELSFLLWSTQGIREIVPGKRTMRTVPSAGARHAFETYLLIHHVDGLKPGLYRYVASSHSVYLVDAPEDISKKLVKGCLDQSQVKESAVTFFWDAVVERMFWRYVERGYRYLHLDAGHVCQNLSLAAEAIHCGVCAIAAYLDDEVNDAIGLDGEKEFIIYIASLGKRE